MFLFAVFLIVGGLNFGLQPQYGLTTEVIDLSKSNVTYSFGDIPELRFPVLGGRLGSSPIICGGSTIDVSCMMFQQSQWTQTHTMTIPRDMAASVQLNATTLWILGGGYGSAQ